jgi:magnesium transporter
MALPTIISGIWGMNVPLPFQNSFFGFPIVILITVFVCALTVWLLRKWKML